MEEVKVFVVTRVRTQNDFTDEYGEQADDSETIKGIYFSEEKANQAVLELEKIEREYTDDLGCDVCLIVCSEYKVN